MQSNTVQRGKHEASRKRGLGAVSWILIAVCVCIAGLSGYKLISKFISYRESKAHYADISEVALEPSGYNSGTKESGESSNPIPQRLINPIPEVDFAALRTALGESCRERTRRKNSRWRNINPS